MNFANAALKIFIALKPPDMRKSFNGLHAMAVDHLKLTPAPEALFAFTNKRRNRSKLLCFDGTGIWVAAKRLERGQFSWPSPSEPDQRRIRPHAEALQLLLDGVDLRGTGFKPWYERPE